MTKIYEGNNHIFIDADYRNPVRHSHKAAHIIIAKEQGMTVTTNETTFRCQGVCIPSGTPHRIDTNGLPVLVFLYDSSTMVSQQIQQVLSIPERVCAEILLRYTQLPEPLLTEQYIQFEKSVMQMLGLTMKEFPLKDPRILRAMDYIHASLSEKLTCKTVSDYVCLSESRFSHLFKQQVGMTFSAYMVYQRIMYVYSALFQGKTITEASLDAGFSSSGHFADVNRRVFGLSASKVMEDCVFMRV